MTRLLYSQEITRPEDVIPYLGQGQRHWRAGYSACELARTWGGAGGGASSCGSLPTVRAALDTCADYRGAELVEGFFEREVDLRTRGRRSQTDLMAFLCLRAGYAVVAVEGKVEEPFGPFVHEWRDGSEGRERRLEALRAVLGLAPDRLDGLRYQLLHRVVSAVFEAERYGCGRAMLLVHSFSAARTSFGDFVAFSEAMGCPVETAGRISDEKPCGTAGLRLCWIADAPAP